MNPVVTPVTSNGLIKFELTKEDEAELKRIKLKRGAGTLSDALMHEMCVMQAVSALTTEASLRESLKVEHPEGDLEGDSFSDGPICVSKVISDEPICVSEVICSAMVLQNDRADITPQERNQLKSVSLISAILNTCPVRRVEKKVNQYRTDIVEYRDYSEAYDEAEERRLEILSKIVAPKSFAARYQGAKVTPIGEAIKIIKEAAAVYHVEDEEVTNAKTSQAGNNEPQGGATGGATQQA